MPVLSLLKLNVAASSTHTRKVVLIFNNKVCPTICDTRRYIVSIPLCKPTYITHNVNII